MGFEPMGTVCIQTPSFRCSPALLEASPKACLRHCNWVPDGMIRPTSVPRDDLSLPDPLSSVFTFCLGQTRLGCDYGRLRAGEVDLLTVL